MRIEKKQLGSYARGRRAKQYALLFGISSQCLIFSQSLLAAVFLNKKKKKKKITIIVQYPPDLWMTTCIQPSCSWQLLSSHYTPSFCFYFFTNITCCTLQQMENYKLSYLPREARQCLLTCMERLAYCMYVCRTNFTQTDFIYFLHNTKNQVGFFLKLQDDDFVYFGGINISLTFSLFKELMHNRSIYQSFDRAHSMFSCYHRLLN